MPLAHFKSEFFSLCLSFVFAKIISISRTYKPEQLLIAALALPVFIGALGIPHHSSLLLVPVLSLLIFLLMPLSFLGLFSNYIEFAVVKMWWNLEHFLNYIHVFYNSPIKPNASFETENILKILIYALLLNLMIYSLGVIWSRKSSSLYYS